MVNCVITICFAIGEETFCIPENELHILNDQIIAACPRNFTELKREYIVQKNSRLCSTYMHVPSIL